MPSRISSRKRKNALQTSSESVDLLFLPRWVWNENSSSVIIIFWEVIPAATLYFVGMIRSCRNMEATLRRSDLMANEQLYWMYGYTSGWEQWH